MATSDLHGLSALAHSVRSAINGSDTFYVRNRHVNYTNIRKNHCAFRAFRREADMDGAYLLSPRQAAELERPANDLGFEASQRDTFHGML